MNDLAGRWPWLDGPARLFLNDYFAPTLMAIILLALWFEGGDKAEQQINQKAVLVATVGTIVGNSLLKIMNLFYFRPRPFVQQAVNLLFYQPADSSLPSNAAVIGFAVAAGVWFYNRLWGGVLLAIAFLFGLSRVFGGVHYPLDVLTGAGLGCFSAWFVYRRKQFVETLTAFAVRTAGRLKLT